MNGEIFVSGPHVVRDQFAETVEEPAVLVTGGGTLAVDDRAAKLGQFGVLRQDARDHIDMHGTVPFPVHDDQRTVADRPRMHQQSRAQIGRGNTEEMRRDVAGAGDCNTADKSEVVAVHDRVRAEQTIESAFRRDKELDRHDLFLELKHRTLVRGQQVQFGFLSIGAHDRDPADEIGENQMEHAVIVEPANHGQEDVEEPLPVGRVQIPQNGACGGLVGVVPTVALEERGQCPHGFAERS